jgi:hypothetical protein
MNMKTLFTFLLAFSLCVGLMAQISIIGPGSPSGNWTTDHDLTQTSPGVWTGTFTLSVGELKFRLDGDWTFNWGGTAWPSGSAIQGGANINVGSAGLYNIEFNLTTETYSFTPPPPANVGIGTTSPTEKLDVAGNIKTTGEIKPNGTAGQVNQVLTSNGDGTMQWAAMSSGGSGGAGAGPWSDWCTDNIIEHFPVVNQFVGTNNFFGRSVSISGDYAIVGAPGDSDGGYLTGSAAIFKRNVSSGAWEQQGSKLTIPGTLNYFGRSVSISGDYAIVGAPQTNIGFAAIFKRNVSSGAWEQQGPTLSLSGSGQQNFGHSVSISGDYAVVGAPNDDGSGSATIYKRNSSTGAWETQLPKLTNISIEPGDKFGTSVAISGDYAIVGAPNDDHDGDGMSNIGSATIFKRNASTGVWEHQTPKLTNPNAAEGDNFGTSVAISGDYAIVGANNDDEGGFTNNGSVAVFKRNASTGAWVQQGTKLTNPIAASNDEFGYSVAIAGDYAIVGAIWDDEGSGLTNNGSATIYRRYGYIWRVVQKFNHPGSQYDDRFGSSIAIDNIGRFLVGAEGVQGNTGAAFFGKVR